MHASYCTLPSLIKYSPGLCYYETKPPLSPLFKILQLLPLLSAKEVLKLFSNGTSSGDYVYGGLASSSELVSII